MKKIVLLLVSVFALGMICSCESVKKEDKGMSHEEFLAAALDSEVVINTYIQGRQSWWENNGVGNASFYTQNDEGGYFLYNLPCSKADYDEKLVVGAHILVKGTKSEWAGEVEITDATFEVLSGSKMFGTVDVTKYLGTDQMADYMNKRVSMSGLEVVAADASGAAFLYRYNGSGSRGDDLYFNVSDGKNTYTFTVESYLCGADTEVYQAVEALKVGDEISLEGFLYWYEGPQPHVTKIAVAK